jgi:hypothetical protein
VRYFAKHAIETITGQPLAIDVGGAAADVRAQAAAWLNTARPAARAP